MAKPGRRFLMASAVALALTGCAAPITTAGVSAPIGGADRLYVSIGDSYAAGYRPSPDGSGSTTTDGFAYQVAADPRVTGRPLELVNFGCAGVTSTALRENPGCAAGASGPGAPAYPRQAQVDAAVAFITGNRERIALVTVVVGGNDIKPCVQRPDGAPRPDATACLAEAGKALRANLAILLGALRSAVGPTTPIVGVTYPDVYLGAWVATTPGARDLAVASVALFRDQLNPALRAEYSAVGALFADITAATGGYGPLEEIVDDPTYGKIPNPVARLCALTYYCRLRDVHPTVDGHRVIADRIVELAHLS
ncbi:GDSL-type esterase/lipase family protein [Umezawaea sp. Da 62-37]|uniref:GDSL-type esterase/lipase family protein n=1 Tax=Umezawaea sp. Da 62-37 TaxID=3075927 RepID=UPI0028F6D605|nr:GDSL-type esterase/lipase family protein [Umezawaea sp. Da 62-37]WNV85111.1 GDSL-type esterase/lipase family protein [Umezawaea sp. Da 62-37]